MKETSQEISTISTSVELPEVPEIPIHEVLDKDPLELTAEDLARTVAWFRERRIQFAKEELTAMRDGRKVNPRKTGGQKHKPKMSLADAGIKSIEDLAINIPDGMGKKE